MPDKKKLKKQLDNINATGFQRKAAFILLAVNGMENAMEYMAGLTKRENQNG